MQTSRASDLHIFQAVMVLLRLSHVLTCPAMPIQLIQPILISSSCADAASQLLQAALGALARMENPQLQVVLAPSPIKAAPRTQDRLDEVFVALLSASCQLCLRQGQRGLPASQGLPKWTPVCTY